MKFSTGFFDGIFGQKMMLRVPQDDGSEKEVRVTKAWFEKMESEGKLGVPETQYDSVPFHVIGPDGSRTRHLLVGVDISQERYEKLVDPTTGALYGLTVYEGGEPETSVVPKHIWQRAKDEFAEIDRLAK